MYKMRITNCKCAKHSDTSLQQFYYTSLKVTPKKFRESYHCKNLKFAWNNGYGV